MEQTILHHTSAFDGVRMLASGPLSKVAVAVKAAIEAGPSGPVVIYDDATGQIIDVDIRGTDAEMLSRLHGARLAEAAPVNETIGTDEPRGRGRPRCQRRALIWSALARRPPL